MFLCFSAFKEVFDLFDSNGGGTIDAEELDLALRSVGICLSQDDIIGVLESMDKDGMKLLIHLFFLSNILAKYCIVKCPSCVKVMEKLILMSFLT